MSFATPKSRILTKSLLPPRSIRNTLSGFEIAVDDAGVVRRAKGRGDLERDAQRPFDGQHALLGHQGPQVQPFEQLHDVEAGAVSVLDEVADFDDVFVVDPVDRAGLGEEAFDRLVIAGVLAAQDLQRHLAPQAGVLGDEDPTHAARADLLDQAVGSEQGAVRVHLPSVRGGPQSRAAGRAGGRPFGVFHAAATDALLQVHCSDSLQRVLGVARSSSVKVGAPEPPLDRLCSAIGSPPQNDGCRMPAL